MSGCSTTVCQVSVCHVSSDKKLFNSVSGVCSNKCVNVCSKVRCLFSVSKLCLFNNKCVRCPFKTGVCSPSEQKVRCLSKISGVCLQNVRCLFKNRCLFKMTGVCSYVKNLFKVSVQCVKLFTGVCSVCHVNSVSGFQCVILLCVRCPFS